MLSFICNTDFFYNKIQLGLPREYQVSFTLLCNVLCSYIMYDFVTIIDTIFNYPDRLSNLFFEFYNISIGTEFISFICTTHLDNLYHFPIIINGNEPGLVRDEDYNHVSFCITTLMSIFKRHKNKKREINKGNKYQQEQNNPMVPAQRQIIRAQRHKPNPIPIPVGARGGGTRRNKKLNKHKSRKHRKNATLHAPKTRSAPRRLRRVLRRSHGTRKKASPVSHRKTRV